jgi:hypothetical protein
LGYNNFEKSPQATGCEHIDQYYWKSRITILSRFLSNFDRITIVLSPKYRNHTEAHDAETTIYYGRYVHK